VNDLSSDQIAAIEAAAQQHLQDCRNRPTLPTDTQLFEEAIACGLVTHIRLAAACHPDKIKLEEVCSPANAALIVFARNVLARWSQ
jgi:hypothetical protein